LSEAIEILKPVTAKLKENEDAIGKQLSQSLAASSLAERTVGVCPTCKTGTLVILHSKKTDKRFVGCTNYFTGTCKTAYPLPQRGIVKPLRRACSGCGSPTVRVWQRGRRAWTLCLNPDCTLKREKSKLRTVQT
jgi:DNA topoisomerase-1